MKPIFYLVLLFFIACRGIGERGRDRIVTDALGRELALPDSVSRIICIRSSAIRLLTYAGGAPLICGIEEEEQQKHHEYTHLFAYPELATLPVIGPKMGGDPELILLAKPDLIFMASTTRGEAEELQRRIGIPVFAIEYGDLGRRRTLFYESLRKIGEVLHTEKRVEQLIHFIEGQLTDLRQRLQGVDRSQRVYVGAISYRGQKGLTSTDPYYAALDFLEVEHLAAQMDTTYVSPITGAYIDWEQLLEWNPEFIFVDAAGWPLVRQEYHTYSNLFRLLSAYRSEQIHLLWPYNNYHSNFEVMLTNAWYIGKVLYPEQFADISLSEKTNEIMIHFVGDSIASELEQAWGVFRNLFDELNGEDSCAI